MPFEIPDGLRNILRSLNWEKGSWVSLDIPLIDATLELPPFDILVGDFVLQAIDTLLGFLSELDDKIDSLRGNILDIISQVQGEISDTIGSRVSEIGDTIEARVGELLDRIKEVEDNAFGAIQELRRELSQITVNPIDWLASWLDRIWYGEETPE
jgi:phage-related protein